MITKILTTFPEVLPSLSLKILVYLYIFICAKIHPDLNWQPLFPLQLNVCAYSIVF